MVKYVFLFFLQNLLAGRPAITFKKVKKPEKQKITF
jgi:hypothetical protein